MNDDFTNIIGDQSRRSVLKKSVLATAGVGLLGASSQTAAAQDGDAGGQKALIFQNFFRPFARFTFVSDVIDWVPNVEEVNDNVWSNYNVRMIRYLNTGEQVPMFVAKDAQIGKYDDQLGFVVDEDDDANQPQVYEMDRNASLFGDSPRLVTVNFSPVPEEEEDAILNNEDWWEGGLGGGEGGGGNQTGTNQTGTNQTDS